MLPETKPSTSIQILHKSRSCENSCDKIRLWCPIALHVKKETLIHGLCYKLQNDAAEKKKRWCILWPREGELLFLDDVVYGEIEELDDYGLALEKQSVALYASIQVPPRNEGLSELQVLMYVCNFECYFRGKIRIGRGLVAPVMSWRGGWCHVLNLSWWWYNYLHDVTKIAAMRVQEHVAAEAHQVV